MKVLLFVLYPYPYGHSWGTSTWGTFCSAEGKDHDSFNLLYDLYRYTCLSDFHTSPAQCLCTG